MEALRVAQQLKDLATDPHNRRTIVRDQGCLPGLVLFLDDQDEKVVLTSLQALSYLAEEPANCPVMKNEIGLTESLKIISKKEKLRKETRDLASAVLEKLVNVHSPSRRPVSLSRNPSMSRGNVFLGASNKKAKVIVLQIHNLDGHAQRRVAEQRLLEVRGVISFTFDLPEKRCTVRVRSTLKPEALCHAIASSGTMTAEQVVKNEFGEEVLLSFGDKPQARHNVDGNTAAAIKLPDYLPEDEQLSEEAQAKAVVSTDDASLSGAGGWLSSVGTFLAKSFYW